MDGPMDYHTKWSQSDRERQTSYDIVYIHHIFYIHSSIDGHSCCFHILAIVNSGAMNTESEKRKGLPWWLRWQRICLQCRRPGFNPWVRKIPWRREWLPTPVFLPGESHGQRSLVGYSPWGHKELDTTRYMNLFKLWFSPNICPGVWLLHHMVALFQVVYFLR